MTAIFKINEIDSYVPRTDGSKRLTDINSINSSHVETVVLMSRVKSECVERA